MELQNSWQIICFVQNVKKQQTTKQKSIVRAWNWTRNLLYRSLMPYLYTTESTKYIDWN